MRKMTTILSQSLLSQSLLSEMQIFVRTPAGETMTLNVQSTDTISDIKQQISDKLGLPCDQQHLLCNGKSLQDGNTLADYTIMQGNTIIITVRCRGGGKSKQPIQTTAKQLIFATPGESFYGKVVRPLGDRRFDVEDIARGTAVQCRLGGSVDYKDRSQCVKADDWVLVAMRDYESETKHHERKGEILLRYSDKQVRQLEKAGVLPKSAAESRAADNIEFVDASSDEADESPRLQQRQAYDMPRTPTSESDEDEGEQEEQEVVPAFAALRVREENLPPPSITKHSRRSKGKSCDSLIHIDLHQRVGFRPEAPPARVESHYPAPVRVAPVAPVTVTIRARVKFWDAKKGTGYATPVDGTQCGVDVRLTAECVQDAGLTRPLLREDVLEVTINPRHDRPFALELRRAR